MDRYRIEDNMHKAYEAVKEVRKSCSKLDLSRTLRGKLSAFGATVMMSGLLPAIAYFVENEPGVVLLLMKMDGKQLPEEMKEDDAPKVAKEFFNQLLDEPGAKSRDFAERFMEYGVSLKLVLNLYIKPEKTSDEQPEEGEPQPEVMTTAQEGGGADGE